MIDWTESMEQTYEFYIVDPNTWKDDKLINTVKSCSINWDSDSETLGSATIDIVESVGECYIRVYLIAIQNGVKEKIPLGTFLVQTPTSSFDGKTRDVSMDAYTPLLELKEKSPPIGYYVPKSVYHKVNITDGVYTVTDEIIEDVIGTAVDRAKTKDGKQVFEQKSLDGSTVYYCIADPMMDVAYRLTRENARAPVVKPMIYVPLSYDFTADINDTWLIFLKDLIDSANCEFALDDLGRILFAPKKDIKSLQPVWTYTDDNSSILQPEMTMDHDLYGVPNVVEVIYSTSGDQLYSRVVNDDPNSPTSTVTRGREIVYRVTNPNLVGIPTQAQIDEYAEQLLDNLSAVEYTITYTHGYCPVKIGDCVRFNYTRAGLKNIKAKVISQDIKCEPGCQVKEKAVFTTNLWR